MLAVLATIERSVVGLAVAVVRVVGLAESSCLLAPTLGRFLAPDSVLACVVEVVVGIERVSGRS